MRDERDDFFSGNEFESGAGAAQENGGSALQVLANDFHTRTLRPAGGRDSENFRVGRLRDRERGKG